MILNNKAFCSIIGRCKTAALFWKGPGAYLNLTIWNIDVQIRAGPWLCRKEHGSMCTVDILTPHFITGPFYTLRNSLLILKSHLLSREGKNKGKKKKKKLPRRETNSAFRWIEKGTLWQSELINSNTRWCCCFLEGRGKCWVHCSLAFWPWEDQKDFWANI